jgi:hypothetical protein
LPPLELPFPPGISAMLARPPLLLGLELQIWPRLCGSPGPLNPLLVLLTTSLGTTSLDIMCLQRQHPQTRPPRGEIPPPTILVKMRILRQTIRPLSSIEEGPRHRPCPPITASACPLVRLLAHYSHLPWQRSQLSTAEARDLAPGRVAEEVRFLLWEWALHLRWREGLRDRECRIIGTPKA